MAVLRSLLRPRTHARHAKPARSAPLFAAGGMTAALAVTDAAVLSHAASAGGTVEQFEALAQCESGGNWSINTGNGYYGGLQFSLATWRGIGYSGFPHQASKATQIQAGQKLQGQSGWGQWPACSRKLGLSGGGGATSTSVPTATTSRTAPAATRTAPAAARTAPVTSRSRTAPAFEGHVLTLANASQYHATTAAWQRQMRSRGWTITVDGLFGPQTASVAQRFAAEKGLRPAVAGSVDRAVFTAAWTAPVT